MWQGGGQRYSQGDRRIQQVQGGLSLHVHPVRKGARRLSCLPVQLLLGAQSPPWPSLLHSNPREKGSGSSILNKPSQARRPPVARGSGDLKALHHDHIMDRGASLLPFISHLSSHPQARTAGREPHPCRARLRADTHRGTSSTSSSSRTRGSNFSLRLGRGVGTKARDEGCGFRGGPSRAKCTQEAALTAGGGSGLPSDPKPVFSLLQPHLHPPQGIEKDTRAPPLCFPQWRAPPGLCC